MVHVLSQNASEKKNLAGGLLESPNYALLSGVALTSRKQLTQPHYDRMQSAAVPASVAPQALNNKQT